MPDTHDPTATEPTCEPRGLGVLGVIMVTTVAFVGLALYATLGILLDNTLFARMDDRFGWLARGIYLAILTLLCVGVWQIGKKHQHTVHKLGGAGPWGLISATMPPVGGFVLLFTMSDFGPWLESHRLAGVALYTTGFVILAGLALLPTYAQAVLGGWAFGTLLGLPAAMLGFVGGSALGYILGRRASGDHVAALIAEHPTWEAIRKELVDCGRLRSLGIVTLLRLPPNSPFALTNLLLSSVRVRPLPYLFGTAIGMLPRTAVAVYIGSTIEGELSGDSIAVPTWVKYTGGILSIIILIVIGTLAKRAIARIAEKNTTAPTPLPTTSTEILSANNSN